MDGEVADNKGVVFLHGQAVNRRMGDVPAGERPNRSSDAPRRAILPVQARTAWSREPPRQGGQLCPGEGHAPSQKALLGCLGAPDEMRAQVEGQSRRGPALHSVVSEPNMVYEWAGPRDRAARLQMSALMNVPNGNEGQGHPEGPRPLGYGVSR